uniref:KANSL3 helical domain-containing protein n=1 Tax=Panagrolaimus superbus TaxID=310955 RepID=A0A914Z1L3_9BILA
MFPERVSFDQIPDHIQTFLNENDATGNCLKIFLEILQKQCCMELAVKKHINPLASYYLYSLQNATLLRSRIFLHFSYELVYAHEWLIRHLEEDVLASYLMLLKFLQAAGTTLGNILITSANPKDQTNITVNEHIRDMLEEKIRDPFTRMLTHLDRKLTNHDTFLMLISPGIKLKNEMNNAVYHAHEQLFAGLTNMGCTIEKIIIKDDDDLSEDFTVIDACEFAVNFIKNKIIDAVKRRPNERIFIASWGVTCLFVHEAVIDVDGVSGIIDLAMPIKSRIESRGKIGDRILLTYCPTMVVSGEDSGEVPDTAEMLNNFHISTGLCVVGKADSSLIVEPSLLASYGITQACISRIILNHVMDFIERVVIDTHNDIHTKKLEVEYPWIITEDLNDHVMRDDTAYGVDETFVDDEEDPSLIKPKELVVVDEIPKTGEPLPEEEDIDLDSSCEIINPEPEPPTVKLEYPENGTSEFVENVKSAIVEHPPTYEYRPSSYTQPILVDTDFETGDVLNEFLDNTVNYETMEVVSEAPTEEAYDEEMEFEEQMAAEAIEGGYTGDQNGYE